MTVQNSAVSPLEFNLRSATAHDRSAIWNLVLRSRINPRDIRWQNFVIATTSDGALLGIGQVKTHKQGTRELASIATVPGARGQGVASAIIHELMVRNPGRLHLYCEGTLVPFYTRLGFSEVDDAALPPDLLRDVRRNRRFIRLFQRITRSKLRLAVMCRNGQASHMIT